MKKTLLLSSLPILSLSLTSCIFSFQEDNSWKEQYGTPTIFLESVKEQVPGNASVAMFDTYSQYHDDNFEIADAILGCAPFETTGEYRITDDKFFTYQAYWQPSTMGPNYCNLVISEKGIAIIQHKTALGRLQSFYFSFDREKAFNIVVHVFDLLTDFENNQIEQPDSSSVSAN